MNPSINFLISCSIVIITIVGIYFILPNVDAIQPHFIGIVLSNTCLTMEKNHVNSTCPRYDELWKYDQSIQHVSGKLVLEPYPHRDNTKMKSECLYYIYYKNTYLVFVDPSSSLLYNCGMQEIIIEASDFTFIGDKDKAKKNSEALTWHHSRINSNCRIIHIDYSRVSLNDTISYLKSDCVTTSFNDTVVTPQHDTKVDLSKTYEYIKQAWLHNPHNKENCIIKQCITVDPFKNPNWKK